MINELIKKYKEQLDSYLEQINLNNKVDEVISILDNKDKFSNFDFSLYKDLFIKANFTNAEILKIENNIKYIKLFINSDEFVEYNNFIEALKSEFIKLNILKKDTLSEDNCKNIINKLNKLKENLENTSFYIEDIDFIFQIFEHFNIEFKDIKDYMTEIIKHNKKVLELHNQDTLLLADTKEEIIAQQDNNFLDSIISNVSFSNLEKNILNNYYLEHKEEFEQKYNSLKNINELQYIFNNLEQNKKLFIILMVLGSIDNINNVIGICKFRNIKINKMLPNIFVSNGIKFNLDNLSIDDEFYKLFSGSYENFINNLNYINLGLDLSKIEPTYYIADGNLVRNNHQILKQYKIDITIDSIECLTIPDLEDKLNKIIESGLYLYFKENPRKLLEIKDKAFFYRLKYAMNNPKIIYKRKHLAKDLFRYDGYGVTEENYRDMVDIYRVPLYQSEKYNGIKNISISETEIHDHPFINMLNELYLNDDKMSYNINGFIISRIKVIKLFNQYLKSVNYVDDNNSMFIGFMYSILDGLMLTENETLVFIKKIMNNLIETYPNELSDLSEDKVGEILFNKSNSKGGL